MSERLRSRCKAGVTYFRKPTALSSHPILYGRLVRNIVLLLLCLTAAAADLSLEIPPVHANLPVQNQSVAVVVSGHVTVTSSGADQLIAITLRADLADLQDKILSILQAELNQDKRCGDRLSVNTASLLPDSPAALLTAGFHYEKFACAKALGREIAKRLVAGNGTLRVRITPEVDSSESVHLRADVQSLDADGQLGEILRSGEFGDALREKIRKTVAADLEKSTNFAAALPDSLRDAAAIQSAEFTKTADAHLRLNISGGLRVSRSQADAIAARLKQ